MCQKVNFSILISGDRDGRAALVALLIENNANLSNSFSRNDKGIFFYYRYKSDARMVLKRMSKCLSEKLVSDSIAHKGASATLKRIAQ